ncbi:MAG: aminotransferase class I/II-fold pyridoxal phosphate-dependent enzyme, partial [Lachnospiraceae bacterium]|nr:aminotransferase class I/II-fold pyridoxal phosphate-dependent enzyme [Lachnospiraceae bacterium]
MDFSVNLNPLLVPKSVMAALHDGIGKSLAYPDIKQREVRRKIAEADGVYFENVYAGAGASEMLMAVTAMRRPKCAVLMDPCFSGYAHALRSQADCRTIRLTLASGNGFLPDLDFVRTALTPALDEGADILYLADPMNPTGRLIPDGIIDEILEIAARTDTAVILDESFRTLSEKVLVPFDVQAGQLRDRIMRYSNLFVIRSYTKSFGLPGIRMGYLIASSDPISRIADYLPEWNLSVPAGKAMEAIASVCRDGTFLRNSYALIQKERLFLAEALHDLGFTVLPSDTCYLLFRGREGLYEALLRRGIMIRDCSDYRGLSGGYYRIAVKTHAENAELIRLLGEVLH